MGLGGISVAKGETMVLPSIAIYERYDSNVFNTVSLPGTTSNDFVTGTTPQLTVVHLGDRMDAGLVAGGIGEQYINNPGLSYFGGYGGGKFILDKLVQRFIPKASLQIAESASYIPQAPTYSTTDLTSGDQVNPFARGIQIVRTNTFTNASFLTGNYALTPTVNLKATYTYSLVRFGHSFASQPSITGHDTNFQSLVAGPQVQVSATDIMGVNFLYQQGDFPGGNIPRYHSYGANAFWNRTWMPEFKTTLFGGATVVNQGANNAAAPGSTSTSSTDVAAYNAGFGLNWVDAPGPNPFGALLPGGGLGGVGPGAGGAAVVGGAPGGIGIGGIIAGGARTIANLNYTGGVFPGVVSGGGAQVSNVVTASVTRRVTPAFYVQAMGQYARSDSLITPTSGTSISYHGYGGNLALQHMIGRTAFVTLSGSAHSFTGTGVTTGGSTTAPLGSQKFDRYTGILSITMLWK